ncbi:MAG TPA: endopeptidase La [Oligoflexia bacterium]|nr:endopeptidase La [Oligoflexia bacterium]HMP26757.1 endopeptidase La [Oligoflexia bacterium]
MLKKRNGYKGGVVDHVSLPKQLPLLPTSDMVPFPGVIMSFFVTSETAARAIEDAAKNHQYVVMVLQKSADLKSITDLHSIGVVARLKNTFKVADGRLKAIFNGLARVKIDKIIDQKNYFSAKVNLLEPLLGQSQSGKKLPKEAFLTAEKIRSHLRTLVENESLPEEILLVLDEQNTPGRLADMIFAHYQLEIPFAQQMLEELDQLQRLQQAERLIVDDLNRFMVAEEIRNRARDTLSKDQQQYYLREQIKLIKKELGEEDLAAVDLMPLKQSLIAAKLPKRVEEEAYRQFSRLQSISAESSEFALIRAYLEWIADLPWSKKTVDKVDLKRARSILNAEHFGLEQIKKRVLEFLSVFKLNPQQKGVILCFVGPPGVGKTSLGECIARALGRKFCRFSLGGVRDEAEIRGHRRTYVGALPGKIIQLLKQCGSSNPVFVLDELDKVGSDFRGDPASALLEVLDHAQNKEFVDHYLNLPFDLSDVLFIATANTTDTIPEALKDRLEEIYISGYTTEEKIQIAKQHLIPKILTENGLEKRKVSWDENAIRFIIERYTKEAGVRQLGRELGSLCRKIAYVIVEKRGFRSRVSQKLVTKFLGVTKFDPETLTQVPAVGYVRGLAWTIFGGEIMSIEASLASGSGNLTLTGQLGEVMQESARAAVFYARANAELLGLPKNFNKEFDIHIHVPAGATPKDGPSAGISIATALISALSASPIASDLAMTGEMTLRGDVLAVGGIKEKVLAALRYGMKRVIIPADNLKDLDQIPNVYRRKLQFFPVRTIREVLELALLPSIKPLAKDTHPRRARTKTLLPVANQSSGKIV